MPRTVLAVVVSAKEAPEHGAPQCLPSRSAPRSRRHRALRTVTHCRSNSISETPPPIHKHACYKRTCSTAAHDMPASGSHIESLICRQGGDSLDCPRVAGRAQASAPDCGSGGPVQGLKTRLAGHEHITLTAPGSNHLQSAGLQERTVQRGAMQASRHICTATRRAGSSPALLRCGRLGWHLGGMQAPALPHSMHIVVAAPCQGFPPSPLPPFLISSGPLTRSPYPAGPIRHGASASLTGQQR